MLNTWNKIDRQVALLLGHDDELKAHQMTPSQVYRFYLSNEPVVVSESLANRLAALSAVSRWDRPEAIRGRVSSPRDIAAYMTAHIGHLMHEEFWAIHLDNQNQVIAAQQAFVGGQDACPVDRRRLLRSALASGARSLILVHNHPSGFSEPSPEDVTITKQVREACDTVGVTLLDHVIVVGSVDRAASMLDLGLL